MTAILLIIIGGVLITASDPTRWPTGHIVGWGVVVAGVLMAIKMLT